jgi:hypothetical protein
MSAQIHVEYEQIVDLVEQLPAEQQNELIARVLKHRAETRPLTAEEKIRLLESIQIDNAINEQPSARRADWYGEDGR